MSNVKRYSYNADSTGYFDDPFMRQNSNGQFVLHSDYASLLARHNALLETAMINAKEGDACRCKYNALVVAVNPVVEWWKIENPIGIYNPTDKILQAAIECGSKTKYAIVTAAQLDALAALVGEEGE